MLLSQSDIVSDSALLAVSSFVDLYLQLALKPPYLFYLLCSAFGYAATTPGSTCCF
ncbi:hypothetical protein BDZ89DRAFT_1066358 [Hymenopellis radicata]|nr:hypothetical protein BDZ89DRAFT_1066358 [Hymenopellis radicata]